MGEHARRPVALGLEKLDGVDVVDVAMGEHRRGEGSVGPGTHRALDGCGVQGAAGVDDAEFAPVTHADHVGEGFDECHRVRDRLEVGPGAHLEGVVVPDRGLAGNDAIGQVEERGRCWHRSSVTFGGSQQTGE